MSCKKSPIVSLWDPGKDLEVTNVSTGFESSKHRAGRGCQWGVVEVLYASSLRKFSRELANKIAKQSEKASQHQGTLQIISRKAFL
jgi:hypothetical protein